MIQARSPVTNSSSSAAARIALPAQAEDIATLRRTLVAKLTYAVGKDPIVASDRDWFVATALAVRDRIVDRWMPSTRAIYLEGRKRVYYLSQEFLIGRLLFDSLTRNRTAMGTVIATDRPSLETLPSRVPSSPVPKRQSA